MRGDGDHIRAERFGPERDLQKALHGVGMEQRERRQAARGSDHVGDRQDGAGLVVDHHDGDEDRIRTQRLFESVDRDIALMVGLQVRDLEAFCLKLLHGMQHCVMLDGGRDDVAAALAEAVDGREDGPVVGLSAAGGEEHAVRLCAERVRDLLPRLTQAAVCRDAKLVYGRGIAPAVRQHVGHRLHAGGTRLRGGGIIKINHKISPL